MPTTPTAPEPTADAPEPTQPLWGQPNPDAALMQGGPSAASPPEPSAPAPAAEPAVETVRVGNLELEVDAQTKAAIEIEMARLGRTTTQPPAPQAPQAPAAPESPVARIRDLNTRIYTEPEEVLSELYQIARDDISSSLRGEYQRAQTEQEFWSTFYQDNADLAQNKFLVKAVVERDRSTLHGLQSMDEVARHIADATRSTILNIKGAEAQPAPKPRAVMRGSQAGARASAPPAEEPSNVTSVTQIIRQRHAKRMGGSG